MYHFAGLDVSVKETSICIVDEQTFSESVGMSHKAIGRPSPPPHRPLPKEPVNARRQRTSRRNPHSV